MSALLVKHLAGVQQHDALPDRRKRAVNLVSFDRRLTAGYRLQQLAQLRDVPLAAVDFIEQAPANILGDKPKGFVEGSACGNDTQIMIKHDQRVADGIDDGMRERNSVFDANERRILRLRRG